MESCSTCGGPRGGACACGAAEPFPLDVFAPEVAAPAPAPSIDVDADAAVSGARPMLVTVAGARAHVVPKAAADELALRARSRGRIPTGIRLVIGRRRKPAPRRSAEPPVAARPVLARERIAPPPPPPEPEPERVVPHAPEPSPVAPRAPEPERAIEPSAPTPSPADPVGSLLGAMASAPRGGPLVTTIPAQAPARARGPVRADRVHVRVTPAEPAGPGVFESAADAARRGAAAIAAAMAGGRAAVVAACALLLGLAAAAPSLSPAWLGAAALALSWRTRRAPTELAVRATAVSVAASAAWAALLIASQALSLPRAADLLLRPQALASWGCVTGLALSAAASLLHARRRPALAAAAVPAAALGAAWLAASPAFAIPAASALLALAATAPLPRSLRDERRVASTTWAASSALLALASALLAVAGAALASAPAAPAWSALPAGLALVPAVAWAALPLARAYDERDRRMARGLVAAGMLLVACALVALASVWWPPAIALALLPLAAVLPLALMRVRDRRHRPRMEAPWLLRDARIATGAAIAVAAAALATLPGGALGLGVLLASLAAACLVDPVVTSHPAARLAVPVAAIGACLSLAAAIGPLPWLPAIGAAALLTVGAARALLAAKSGATDAAARLLMLGSALTLAGSLAACAAGATTAGLAGAGLSLLAPLTAWLPGPARRRDDALVPLHAALAALATAAPLLALGAPQWIAPLFALESWAAWLVSRARPRALAVVAALAVATPVALAAAARGSATEAWTGALALGAWLALALAEGAHARREPWRATRAMAAGLGVAALLALVAWVSALMGIASVALLSLAAALQAVDRLSSDATIAKALRGGATLSWMAGAVLATLAATADPEAGLVLAGAALAALLVAALRRAMEPVAWSGVAAALALASACREVGIPLARHPAVYAVPPAMLLVGWGVLRSLRRAPARGWLLSGLLLLAGAVLLEAHLPGAAPLLRVVAAGLAATMIAGGVVARHRVPVVAGALALAAEGAWLLGEGAAWIARHPLPGVSIVAALGVAAATGLAHLAWRAGGRVPLLLAWTSDWARLRDAWSRWS